MSHQAGEGDLRGIAGAGEHRLAEKHPADRDPIESSGEIPVDPGFDRVRVSETVQTPVGLDHRAADPGTGLAIARRGAAGHDFVEDRIEAHSYERLRSGFPKEREILRFP